MIVTTFQSEAETRPPASWRHLAGAVPTLYRHRSLVVRHHRGEQTHDRRLASPVGPDKAEHLPWRAVEMDALDRRHAPETLGQAADFDRGFRLGALMTDRGPARGSSRPPAGRERARATDCRCRCGCDRRVSPSRAARFGVSPTTPRSCASPEPRRSPTTTIPVAMPTRTCSGSPAAVSSFGAASTIASPARTARSASCSCAWGRRRARHART